MKNLTGLLATVLLCANALADEIDLSFNSDAVRFFYVHEFASNDLSADFGFLNNSDEGLLLNTSLYLTGLASDGRSPLQAGIGGRTGYADGEDSDQTGIPVALGGFVKYTLPEMNRLSIRIDAYYAPDILTLMDLEKYEDYTIRVGYNVLKEADVYIGARYVKGEYDNGSSARFDSGMNIGLNIRF